jgi:hypothetical protein
MNLYINKISIVIVIIIVLIALDFGLNRKLTITSDFKQDYPLIGTPYPPGRMSANVMIGEPVYFKVYLPHFYEKAIVKLKTNGDYSGNVMMGLVGGEGNEQLQIMSSQNINMFNISRNIELKFIISAPGVSETNPLTLENVSLEFTRDNPDLIGYLSIWTKQLRKIF